MEQWMRRQWENRKYVLHTPTFHFFFPWRCATLALWMSRRVLTACWPVLVPLTDVWTELVAHPHWDLWLPVKAEEVGGERVGLPPLTFLQKQKYVQDSWKPIKQSAIHPALNPQCHSDGTFNSIVPPKQQHFPRGGFQLLLRTNRMIDDSPNKFTGSNTSWTRPEEHPVIHPPSLTVVVCWLGTTWNPFLL